MEVKLSIIYYSSTGTNYQLSQWAMDGAKDAGAGVRVLKVTELAPETAIAANPAWKAHAEATKDVLSRRRSPDLFLASLTNVCFL